MCVPAVTQCVCVCLEGRPGVCTQEGETWACLIPSLLVPTLFSHLSSLTVRVGRASSGPGWGSDLPDWLPLLCFLSLQDPTAFPVPTFQDLAGFWDLLQLSIEDVTLKFLELQQLKANSWKLLEPKVGGGPFNPSPDCGKCPSPWRHVGVGCGGDRRRDPWAAKAAHAFGRRW